MTAVSVDHIFRDRNLHVRFVDGERLWEVRRESGHLVKDHLTRVTAERLARKVGRRELCRVTVHEIAHME